MKRILQQRPSCSCKCVSYYCNEIPLERIPVRTKIPSERTPHQNESFRSIRSKNAFVLMGFRSDGPSPILPLTNRENVRILLTELNAPKSNGLILLLVRYPTSQKLRLNMNIKRNIDNIIFYIMFTQLFYNEV